MNYYIDNNNHLFEKNGIDFRVKKGLQTLEGLRLATDEEVDLILNPPKSTEELQEIETQWRNAQLSSTDEFGLNDYPDNKLRSSMREYRQLLRDYPSVEGFGDESLRPIDPRN